MITTCPCPSKTAHPTRDAAICHLRRLRAVGASPDLNVYHCVGHWHVGRSVVRLRRRIRRALSARYT
jgi:acetyl esterase/lipase